MLACVKMPHCWKSNVADHICHSKALQLRNRNEACICHFTSRDIDYYPF